MKIHKDRCANCNEYGANLVEYGGFYYHRYCLTKLLTGLEKSRGDKAMFKRLNKAFNNTVKEKG